MPRHSLFIHLQFRARAEEPNAKQQVGGRFGTCSTLRLTTTPAPLRPSLADTAPTLPNRTWASIEGVSIHHRTPEESPLCEMSNSSAPWYENGVSNEIVAPEVSRIPPAA